MFLSINSNNLTIYNFIITYIEFTTNILSFTKIKNIFMITKSFHYRNIISKILINSLSNYWHIITFGIILTILKRIHITFKFFISISLNVKITINISIYKHFIIFSISRHLIMLIPSISYLFKLILFINWNFNNNTICVSRYTMNTFKF